MGLEPSFSRSTLVWPLAGPDALPLEPSDPALVIPRGALQISHRDMTEDNIEIGAEPLPAPQEKLGGAPASPAKRAKRWPIAVVASCGLHAAVAMVLLTTPQWWPSQDDPTQIEGADQTGMMVAGNADADQAMAGDVTQVTLVPMVDAKPVEIVEAQAVATNETAQPVEQVAALAPATEVLEPVTDPAPIQSEIERVEPDTPDPAVATTPAPEILAATSPQPDSDSIAQQAEQAEAVEPVQETSAAPAQATQPVTEEEIETPEVVAALPEPRPVHRAKPAETPKPVEKQAKKAPAKPKPSKPKAGSGGANQADSKRGVASGESDGDTAIASKGGARSSAAGNAAVSNYPGKVAAKLRRASRSLSRSDRAKASNNAQVSFVVNAQGGVGGVRLVKSSGSPGLDETALSIIRRAAPFPPIPVEAGRSSWAFTLPIGPF